MSRRPPTRAEIRLRRRRPRHSIAPPSALPGEQSYQRRVGELNSPSTGRTVVHRSRTRPTGSLLTAAPSSRVPRPGRSGLPDLVRRLLRRRWTRLPAVPAIVRPTPATPSRPGPARSATGGGGGGLRRCRARLPADVQGAGTSRPGTAAGGGVGRGRRRVGWRPDVARPDPVSECGGASPRWSARRAAGPACGPRPSPTGRRSRSRPGPRADRGRAGQCRAHRGRAPDRRRGQVRRSATASPAFPVGQGGDRRRPGDDREHRCRCGRGPSRRWPSRRRCGGCRRHSTDVSSVYPEQRHATVRAR